MTASWPHSKTTPKIYLLMISAKAKSVTAIIKNAEQLPKIDVIEF